MKASDYFYNTNMGIPIDLLNSKQEQCENNTSILQQRIQFSHGSCIACLYVLA